MKETTLISFFWFGEASARLCYPCGGEDCTGKVAKTQAEKLQLIEAGFEFVSADPDGTQYFRKRK
jgi:hypothetical protein